MIPIKLECRCGQHYAFDVEPADGRMPGPVACPACGADGTEDANQAIAKALAPAAVAPTAPRMSMAAPHAPHVPPPVSAAPLPPEKTSAAPVRSGEPPALPGKLAWYDQAWIALPIALVVVGGLIGGACGGLAWGINKIVFAKIRNPIARYVVTGLISATSVVVWLVAVALLVTAIKRR